eukprot:8291343-Lingulodinium_polyedra.AAC.1
MGVAEKADRTWHLRLMTYLALGIEQGVYKSRKDMPFLRNACDPAPRPGQEEPAQTEAKEAVSAAGSSTDAGVAQEPSKAPLQAGDKDVSSLRAKCRNS